ncbi:uncharacterized protein LOC116297739 [Actinia tenebrosa]|uniref:Uncharacterized protein LOC116297739 n=1 Tax=Actinia tenebrosa TaxID=6105 RepID=A0A6P8I263_ACTTE|nr:uncharacterized protein LOC116297739 [Actinia tenebrosa]
MALLQYGSTGQTSTIITTGPTRDESTSTLGTRRSLADDLNQLDENTEGKERNRDPIEMGQKVDGTTKPKESSNRDVNNGRMMQSSSRHTDDVNHHVLFTNAVQIHNEHGFNSELESGNSPPRRIERVTEPSIHNDNQNNVDGDERDLADAVSRVRSVTSTSVCTHSDAEECNESDFSIAMSLSTDTITFRRGSRTGSFSSYLLTPRRRRRRISRPGALVTDSYADECICCCSIL